MRSGFFTLFVLFLIVLAVCIPCRADKSGERQQYIDIVESVPVETNLDLREVPKTGDVWLDMIRNAKHSLDIEVFYFASKKGEPMEDVLNAIKEAGARGVKVRIIADESFKKESIFSEKFLEGEKNITWKWISSFDAIGGIMHAKYFVVDKNEAFLGSQNFDWRSIKHISEIGVRVKHEGFAKCVCDLFETDWKLCDTQKGKPSPAVTGSKNYPIPFKIENKDGELMEFYPVFSPKGMIPENSLLEENHIVKLIDEAKKELLLQVLTYSPSSPHDKSYYAKLDEAIRRAANRGVNVKIVVSDWSTREPHINYLKSLAVLKNISIKISTIPRWSEGYIPYARVQHSKYLVADGNNCWIGSSNWERGYFYNCRNLGIIITSKSLTSLLRKIFFNNWTGSYTNFIDITKQYEPPQTSP